uniref:Secreted protein n=1 Tax=Strongyloides venezuelensis TaxID=75913 RepID=A0A0K0FY82_STRVS
MKLTAASIFASIGLISAQFGSSTLGGYGTSGYGMIGNSCCGNYNNMYGTSLSGFGGLSNFGSVLPVNSMSYYRNDPFSMNSGIGYPSGLMNSQQNYGLSNSLYSGMSQLSNYPISDPILAGALSSYNGFNGLNSLNQQFPRLGDSSIYPHIASKKASPVSQEPFSLLNEGI